MADVEEAHQRLVAEREAWAREVLANPNAVIFDTETTGLDVGTARIVEVAVTTPRREVLMNTLVNPGERIPVEAMAVHHITNDMVADAPNFAQITEALTRALAGKYVLAYNGGYHFGVLAQAVGLPVPDLGSDSALSTELAGATLADAMIPYSDWCGDWNEDRGNHRYQCLDGGNRTLNDCFAIIDRLETMAEGARS